MSVAHFYYTSIVYWNGIMGCKYCMVCVLHLPRC